MLTFEQASAALDVAWREYDAACETAAWVEKLTRRYNNIPRVMVTSAQWGVVARGAKLDRLGNAQVDAATLPGLGVS